MRKWYPNIPFIIQQKECSVAENFDLLHQEFEKTNYRYWLFLDDDIEFVVPPLEIALATLVQKGYGGVGVYFTNVKDELPVEEVVEKEIMGTLQGYFLLVDSWKVGHLSSDRNLPYKYFCIDIDYSLAILSSGFLLGYAPTFVYHDALNKNTSVGTFVRIFEGISKNNQYLREKWGSLYSSLFSPLVFE